MLKRLIETNLVISNENIVVSLTSLGVVGESLRSSGFTVHTLGMTSPVSFFITLWRLIKLIRQYRPAIVQTWMYHADLMGGIAARLAGSCSVVWGVRSTAIPQGRLSITYWLVRLCAICSYFLPDRIVCCAESAKAAHIKLHYLQDKMIVIPNGYDFSRLQLDVEGRIKARVQLGVDERDIVIGVVGRFDPLKDFFNFISAAALVLKEYPNVQFLMVGRDNEWSNTTLRGWVEGAGLENVFHLVGQQLDIARYLSVMDIFCLSSVDEAFPNVLAEAMAMGLPCVSTRAGDAATILDDENYVVPVRDPLALANALLKMCNLDPSDRKILGNRNSGKVRSRYGIDEIREKYAEIYELVMKQRR